MDDMLAMNATDVRKEWSGVVDTAVRRRPVFIKRTRDYLMLSDVETQKEMLRAYNYSATILPEEDGSITLSCDILDIVVNAPTLEQAKSQLAKDIIEYATEFYKEFDLWKRAPNRRSHIPYVMKALLAEDSQELEGAIKCQDGKN